jgi:hypothetical protein
MRRAFVNAALIAVTIGCTGRPTTGVRMDAGARADAGNTADAGLTPDAGVTVDASVPTDAGLTPEAGFSVDAGVFVPVSNAGCRADAGGGEYLGCTTNADCACPLSCQTDPVALESTTTTVCLPPCATSGDCPDPTSFCLGGVCRTKQCAFANGFTGVEADGGAFWGPCNADGINDGICLPIGIGVGDVIGVCQLTGTLPLGSACLPLVTRDAGPGALCVQGAECLNNESVQFQNNPPFSCQAVCDPNRDGGQCASGDVCILSPIAGTEDGQLRFPGGEAEFGVCSGLGDAGCLDAVQDFATQWGPCTTDADCACDQHCLADPLTHVSLCASSCTSTAGCSDPATSCQGGACWPNLCPGDGGLAARCNAAQTGDGTCLGTDELSENLDPGAGINRPGAECVQAGTASQGADCEPDFPDRGAPSRICQPGAVCAGQPDGGGVCRDVCRKGSSCGTGSVCALTFFDRGAADLADVVYACYPQGANGCIEGWGSGGTSGCTANKDCPCPLSCNRTTTNCE